MKSKLTFLIFLVLAMTSCEKEEFSIKKLITHATIYCFFTSVVLEVIVKILRQVAKTMINIDIRTKY